MNVTWDSRNDRWETGRRAMLAYDPDADWHCVIQDDAIPCRDLFVGLEKALDHVPPNSPVCLYTGRVRPIRERVKAAAKVCKEASASWLVMKDINWGVGVCVPTRHIEEMVRESDKVSVSNYDSRMSGFFAKRGIPVYYTWPSLVDHRDSPSLVPDRGGKRHAFWFIGEDKSALDVDWSGPVVGLAETTEGASVSFRSRRTGHVVTFAAISKNAKVYRNRSQWVEL